MSASTAYTTVDDGALPRVNSYTTSPQLAQDAASKYSGLYTSHAAGDGAAGAATYSGYANATAIGASANGVAPAATSTVGQLQGHAYESVNEPEKSATTTKAAAASSAQPVASSASGHTGKASYHSYAHLDDVDLRIGAHAASENSGVKDKHHGVIAGKNKDGLNAGDHAAEADINPDGKAFCAIRILGVTACAVILGAAIRMRPAHCSRARLIVD